MKITAIKTEKIAPNKKSLIEILDTYVKKIPEGSVLAITSKIVSLCEGSVEWHKKTSKAELIKKHASYYIEPQPPYNITLTIAKGILAPTAGIDESNSGGCFVLWPKNAQKTANAVRSHLSKKFHLKKFGVIITDSTTRPLRHGTTGIALSHSGFNSLHDYIGTPDIFGRLLKVTKANLIDALAAAAVLLMGEGNEQTPLALIEDVPFIKFQKKNPAVKELSDLAIPLTEDLYAPLLKNAPWKHGRGK